MLFEIDSSNDSIARLSTLFFPWIFAKSPPLAVTTRSQKISEVHHCVTIPDEVSVECFHENAFVDHNP
jgi:hypothetical protein